MEMVQIVSKEHVTVPQILEETVVERVQQRTVEQTVHVSVPLVVE